MFASRKISFYPTHNLTDLILLVSSARETKDIDQTCDP